MHRVPEVVAESGMCVDGWIPVDVRGRSRAALVQP
jgi:hypothetical protein